MGIVDEGVVYSAGDRSDRSSCAFPDISVLPDGRWLCSFRAAPTKGATTGQRALLAWSADEGRTWSEPEEPFTPPRVDGRPGLFRRAAVTPLGGDRLIAELMWVDHSQPSRPFFNTETEGLLDTRMFLAESGDAGRSWSRPRLLDTSPFNQPTPSTGPILRLANGDLACQFELNKPYEDTSLWRHASAFIFSRDQARTWGEATIVHQDPTNRVFYWDQRPAVLPDGRVLDVFWTYDTETATYLNIHASASEDNGRTWSDLWDTGLPGQPGPPAPMSGGALAMPYVDRSGPPAIKVRTSLDGGRSWPEHTEIVLHESCPKLQTFRKQTMEDAWAEMGAFSVGLPATALCGNGDMLVVYYAGPETDRTDIRWARVAKV